MRFPSIRSLLDGSAAALVLAIFLGMLCRSAGAAETEDEIRRSREHYKKGEEAFAAGHFEEAYSQFESGYGLVPRPLFLLNMAHSERRRGQLTRARALYKRYLLVEPQSKFRAEVESVISEIDAALAADAAAKAASRPPLPVTTLPAAARPVAAAPVALDLATAPVGSRGAAAGGPIYRRWWFWAAGGAVAAAVVAGALLSRGDGYQKAGTLGTLGMP